MAQRIVLEANAKINLFLEITGKRPDGYHDIDSVMQSVTLSDKVTVTERESGITLSCGGEGIPQDERNVAWKAAGAFFGALGKEGGCDIKIEKRIPSCAGLGGASADAAAVFIALDILYGIPFSESQLLEISSRVGADIPFCIAGGLCRVGGFGERVEKMDGKPCFSLLIAKPDEGISTKDAYLGLDSIHGNYACYSPLTADGFRRALESGDLTETVQKTYNSFEDVLDGFCPRTLAIISDLRNKAGNCRLSGSGSAVFSVFSDEYSAREAEAFVREKYPDCFVCVCGCADRGVVIREFCEAD